MSFEVIETQEQLDKIISDRIARAKEAAKKEAEAELGEKYKGYDDMKKELEQKTSRIDELGKELEKAKNDGSGYSTKLEELQKKVQKYESDSVKTRIAREFNLDPSLADRLSGQTEEEIKKDAKALKDIIGTTRTIRVPFTSEGGEEDNKEAALKKMLQDMKGE